MHARDFEETVELLDAKMMPLFDTHYISGPEDVEYIGVTNEDHVELLLEDGDSLAALYSRGE